jgi:hypothetical protein
VTVAPVAIELAEFGGKSPRRLFWERFRQDKAAIAGGVVVVLLVLTAIFGGPLAAKGLRDLLRGLVRGGTHRRDVDGTAHRQTIGDGFA